MSRSNRLTQIFRSVKTSTPNTKKRVNSNNSTLKQSSRKTTSSSSSTSSRDKTKKLWDVYLIISKNIPIKTYVGATSNFYRRLKQHNGKLSGGAKATRAGKPWVCACLIRGFKDQSEACVFESKWKNISKNLPRERKNTEEDKQLVDGSLMLLQHRQAALNMHLEAKRAKKMQKKEERQINKDKYS